MPPWLPLPESFEQIGFAGLARWQWLMIGVLLILSIVAGHFARFVLTRIFRLRYKLFEPKVTPEASRGVKRALVWLAAAMVWWLAMPDLRLPPLFAHRAYTVVQIVTIIAFVWLAYSLWDAACDALAERAAGMGRRTEKLLVPVTRKFVRAVIIVAGGLIAMATIGVNVGGILAGVGIGGLVVALAAKDSVENIFGSFTILFDMPFALGDWVKIGPIEGKVEEINLRSTRIRTAEDSLITLPNSNLIRASVENLGSRRYRRLRFTFGVVYDTPQERLEAFLQGIRDLLARHPKVRREGAVAELHEFTDAAMRILLECGTEAANYQEEIKVRSDILTQINELARNQRVQLTGAPKPEEPQPNRGVAEPAEVGEERPIVD
jgi:MscS family membrane protein